MLPIPDGSHSRPGRPASRGSEPPNDPKRPEHRTGSEHDHAPAKKAPLEDARPQAAHPLQDGRADAVVVPAVPGDQAPASRVPPLRLLQGARGDLRRGRLMILAKLTNPSLCPEIPTLGISQSRGAQ